MHGVVPHTFLQMTLIFDANGAGLFMTGNLLTKISHEATSSLSALNLPWYFESEQDPLFYLAGSMDWSPVVSLNATLPTSAPFFTSNSNYPKTQMSHLCPQSKRQRVPFNSAALRSASARCASLSSSQVVSCTIGVEMMMSRTPAGVVSRVILHAAQFHVRERI